MRHDLGLAADHVFANVDDCLPEHVRARLESLLFAAQSDLADKAFPNARDRSKAIEVRGEKLIKDCLEILATANVVSEGACHACKKMCSKFPDAAMRMVYLWLEVAGSPCIPFIKGGAYGNGLAWLHETTIPFLSWAHAMRVKKPDMILHECVGGFTPETLRKVLNQVEDLYDISSLVFSPNDMGYGVRRDRRYSLCVRKEACERTEKLFDEKLARMLFAAPLFVYSACCIFCLKATTWFKLFFPMNVAPSVFKQLCPVCFESQICCEYLQSMLRVNVSFGCTQFSN